MQKAAKILDSTVFIGVYGAIDPHPWIGPEILDDEDLYRLFVTRSVAMGWTWTGFDEPRTVLWGMNDAGQDWTKGATPTRVAWVQVSAPLPTESVYVKRPIPVEPLLVCAGDALNRIGTLSLTAVQLLLPVQASGSAESQLISTVTWFGTSDPAARATVRITLDTGEGEGLRPLARELLALVHARHTGPFVIGSLSSDDAVAVDPQPPVVDDRWRGRGRSPVTFEATVPEWSLDAVGWLVALFADACRHIGVETSVLVGVAR